MIFKMISAVRRDNTARRGCVFLELVAVADDNRIACVRKYWNLSRFFAWQSHCSLMSPRYRRDARDSCKAWNTQTWVFHWCAPELVRIFCVHTCFYQYLHKSNSKSAHNFLPTHTKPSGFPRCIQSFAHASDCWSFYCTSVRCLVHHYADQDTVLHLCQGVSGFPNWECAVKSSEHSVSGFDVLPRYACRYTRR